MCKFVTVAGAPLTPNPSPARGEGRRYADKAVLYEWCQHGNSPPLAPFGCGVGGEGEPPLASESRAAVLRGAFLCDEVDLPRRTAEPPVWGTNATA
jgi:hypothetical protein